MNESVNSDSIMAVAFLYTYLALYNPLLYSGLYFSSKENEPSFPLPSSQGDICSVDKRGWYSYLTVFFTP